MEIYLLLVVLGINNNACDSESTDFVSLATERFVLDGFQLETFVIDTLYFNSIIKCVRECVTNMNCKSINYNSQSGQCQPNSENHLSKVKYLRAGTGNQYYIVRDYEKAISGGCLYSTCDYFQQCEDNAPGSWEVFTCTNCQFTHGCTFAKCSAPSYNITANNTVVTYQLKGCYQSTSSNRPMPTSLQNFRGGINWYDMTLTLNACASLTFSFAGVYDSFGVEFFGECYGGTNVDLSTFTAISATQCASSQTYHGTGGSNVMCVYSFI